MEENKEKKQIKISLEVAIFSVIVLIGIIVVMALIIMNKNNDSQSELTSSNSENRIENNIVNNEMENINPENEIEEKIINNTINTALDNGINNENKQPQKQEVKEEAKKTENELQQTQKPQQQIQEKEPEKNIISEEQYVQNVFVTYSNDWNLENSGSYATIRKNNNYVRIYQEIIAEIDLDYMENLLNKYFVDGESYAFIRPTIIQGFEKGAKLTTERKVIREQDWLIVHIKDGNIEQTCMYTVKNGYEYFVETLSNDSSSKVEIHNIVNSIGVPEG